MLFTDTAGNSCSGEAVARTWNQPMGSNVVDDLGEPSSKMRTKHSARHADAQLLVSSGRQLAEVQYMGRWGGLAVVRCAAEAAGRLTAPCAQTGTTVPNRPGSLALWELQDVVQRLKLSVDSTAGLMEAAKARTCEPWAQALSVVEDARCTGCSASPDIMDQCGRTLYACTVLPTTGSVCWEGSSILTN